MESSWYHEPSPSGRASTRAFRTVIGYQPAEVEVAPRPVRDGDLHSANRARSQVSPVRDNHHACPPRAKHCDCYHQLPRGTRWKASIELSRCSTTPHYTTQSTTLASPSSRLTLSLLWLCLALVLVPCQARHYIAPGPCTWTHVAPSTRDMHFKSTLPSVEHHHHHGHLHSQGSGLGSEFDVSLRCSVPALTPFTLNLSLIEPQHTVQLSIQCFGTEERSTLRAQSGSGHHLATAGPFDHLRSLRTLTVDQCKLDQLPSDTFRGLLSLRNLTIRNTVGEIQESFLIEPHSFRHVDQHLEHLDLGFNQLGSLPADLFCPFVQLHTLNLSHNYLLDLASFGLIDPVTGRLCLQELKNLDLSHNRLEFVPETSGVAALQNLRHLNLSSNHITEIAELTFSALRNLHVLDLSYNRLRTLPSRMFRGSDELRELHLAGNGLENLPQGLFTGLSKLLVLDISGNTITEDTLVADTFVDLIRVVVLNLSHNRLRRLPGTLFQNLYSLQVLSIEGNQLESIDGSAFATLYNLHTLRLSGNRFRHLPDSVLSGLFVLHQLSLSNNYLEHVHEDAFRNCSSLQSLDLSENRLTALPVALRHLRNLKELSVSANKFTTFTDPGPLVHLQQLSTLDLSDNYLVNVSRVALRPMANSLRELRLDGNQLRALERNTLEDLKHSLRVLRLDRNEISEVSSALADVKLLDKLETLNVSYNRIIWFDYTVIPTTLRKLDLSGNRIEQLGNYYELESQLHLEDLDVSDNQISSIAANSIPNSIRILNLRSNRIDKIDQFTFVAKHNVTFVDLRNNSLRRIDNNAFRLGVQRPATPAGTFLIAPHDPSSEFDTKFLPTPTFLIAGNPYYCDCTMEWLQRVNQLVGGVTGNGAISTYPRIGDLDQVICELPFTRQATTASMAPTLATDTLDSKPAVNLVPLLQANSSNFLCRYRTHCFALCHCCEFDACDCEMMCPENCTCYYDQTWNTNIVDCSAAHYKAVPARIPMDVTALYLDGNRLSHLPAHTFIGRKNLRVLHLNHSSLETIANRSFNGLVYLEELHLEYNKLGALHGYEFESLHYLTTLHLNHNQISYIADKTFTALRSLQVLRLENNQLTTFAGWFSSQSLLPSTVQMVSSTSLVPQRRLELTLAHNRWSCQCNSVSPLYDTLRILSTNLHMGDAAELQCLNGSVSHYLLRDLREIEINILERCNISATHPFPVVVSTSTTTSVVTTISPTTSTTTMITTPVSFFPNQPEIENPIFSEGKDTDTTYQPIDKIWPDVHHSPGDPVSRLDSENSLKSQWSGSLVTFNIFWSILLAATIIFLAAGLFVFIRRKQDIQLWFYGRYGVRLFEGGLCGCRSGGTNRSQSRQNGFNDHYVRDSEKLFDAFVIYAKPDENFVTQQLAAELECGYPPYRLCLRYRDLPAPNLSALENGGTLSTKDHGFAFEAVTQAIECSRRTVVVISESFLQSEWCKFELKAAHQETLTSCKTHRLIVVIVPSPHPSPTNPPSQHHANQLAKSAEMLLQRLDSEIKTCIRGVTILTWGERRFWEKFRFSMPASAASGAGSTNGGAPVCSGESVKGRTSTVVVTNQGGYPSLAPSSLSSSSSLARSSVLYDTTTQPIYYQHHYHYAQLPASNTASLHKSSSLSIFAANGKAQLTQNGSNQNTPIRNPFSSKPLPPPPNQPLPPLPLVNSTHFGTLHALHHVSGQHQKQSSLADSIPPTYASCSEFSGGVEYGEAESSITSSGGLMPRTSATLHRAVHHGQFYPAGLGHHPSPARRAPLGGQL